MAPSTRERLTALWPPARLRIQAGDLELRYLEDDLMVQLADLAGHGVHEPEAMPFVFPWTRGTPTEVARSLLGYQWRARASVTPQRWCLELAVLYCGEPVGIQAIEAEEFLVAGMVTTGSWLGQEHQGGGLGTRMRAGAAPGVPEARRTDRRHLRVGGQRPFERGLDQAWLPPERQQQAGPGGDHHRAPALPNGPGGLPGPRRRACRAPRRGAPGRCGRAAGVLGDPRGALTRQPLLWCGFAAPHACEPHRRTGARTEAGGLRRGRARRSLPAGTGPVAS